MSSKNPSPQTNNTSLLAEIESSEMSSLEKERKPNKTLFRVARGAFHTVAEGASNVPGAIGGVVKASPLPSVAEAAGNAAGAVSKTASSVAKNVASAAGGAAFVFADAASTAAKGIVNTAEQGIKSAQEKADDIARTIKENSRENVVKQAKMAAFQDGMRQAEYLIAQKNYDLYCALAALSWYVVRCDGKEDEAELAELQADMELLRKRADVPADIWEELDRIASNKTLGFSDVCGYLDKVGIETLEELEKDMEQIILADGEVTAEEDEAARQFVLYMNERRGASGVNNDQ